MTKAKRLWWILPVVGVVLAVTVCAALRASDGVRLPAKWDLRGKTMYVHNITCSEPYEMRTVDGEESRDFCREVISLCTKAEKFRPSSELVDMVMGARQEPYVRFEDEEERYVISFFDTERQLDVGFVHREAPMISVEKATRNAQGNYKTDWAWRCTMTAADYATLYNLLQNYGGGEKIK